MEVSVVSYVAGFNVYGQFIQCEEVRTHCYTSFAVVTSNMFFIYGSL